MSSHRTSSLSLFGPLVGLVGIALSGCTDAPPPPPAAAPALPTLPGAAPANSPAATPASNAPAIPAVGAGGSISPELEGKVNELVRLTKQYNELAASIQDRATYLQKSQELAALQENIEPLVIEIEVAQSKMPPATRAEFERKYFEGLAKPVVDESRRQKARLGALLQ